MFNEKRLDKLQKKISDLEWDVFILKENQKSSRENITAIANQVHAIAEHLGLKFEYCNSVKMTKK